MKDGAVVFDEVIRTRRSVRKFTEERIPEEVVRQCIEWGTLAPNSSNLQTWRFHWLRDGERKDTVARACMGQKAATTASDLIVVTVRPGVWRRHARWNLAHYPNPDVPNIVRQYYEKLVYILYGTGPWGLLAPFKWLLITAVGLRMPIVREPLTPVGRRLWAVKTAALACENIMLGFVAHGFDTCPMEGYDRNRVRRALGLPRGEHIVMVIGAGRRAPGGVYHEQYRLPLEDVLVRHA